MLIPLIVISPELAWIKPRIDFIVVVFPAPLGPKKPKISPDLTLNEILSTALKPLNVFTRPFTSIAEGSSFFLRLFLLLEM